MWLEDPTRYSYLRRTGYTTFGPRFPVKGMKNRKGMLARLVGYQRIGGVRYGAYDWIFFWLKSHDRDLDPTGPYAGPMGEYGGGMPCEAVDPRALVAGVKA